MHLILQSEISFSLNPYINYPFFLFMYLFLAVLCLCCTWAFSSCSEQRRATLVAIHGLLIAMASLVVDHRLQVCRLQSLWHEGSVVADCGLQNEGSTVIHMNLVAAQHVEFSWTRDQTCDPCIGRWILNHQTTGKSYHFFSVSQILLLCPAFTVFL